jgi:hypothetical protein
VIGAMDRDSLVAVRRIRQPIESLHDIPNAFDPISYSKGAGVLAMFERWVGAETFRKGIRRYLDERRFGTATADDLLRALSGAAARDVVAPFQSFLDQPGVPLVAASVACDGGAPAVTLRQSRYLPVGSDGDAGARWQIPVCLRYGAGGAARERCVLSSSRARPSRWTASPAPTGSSRTPTAPATTAGRCRAPTSAGRARRGLAGAHDPRAPVGRRQRQLGLRRRDAARVRDARKRGAARARPESRGRSRADEPPPLRARPARRRRPPPARGGARAAALRAHPRAPRVD